MGPVKSKKTNYIKSNFSDVIILCTKYSVRNIDSTRRAQTAGAFPDFSSTNKVRARLVPLKRKSQEPIFTCE